MVGFKMQLRNLANAQAPPQLASQIAFGMLQSGHSCALRVIVASQADLDGREPRTWTHYNLGDDYLGEPRIGKLIPNDLGKLLAYRFRNSLGTMLHLLTSTPLSRLPTPDPIVLLLPALPTEELSPRAHGRKLP